MKVYTICGAVILIALAVALFSNHRLIVTLEQYQASAHGLAVACYNEGFAQGKVEGMNLLIDNKIKNTERTEGCK